MSKAVPPAPPTATVLAFLSRFDATASARGSVDAWVLSITLSGRAQVEAGAETFDTITGTCDLIRPGTRNAWSIPDVADAKGQPAHWQVLYLIFQPRPHWYPWLQYKEISPGYAQLKLSPKARAKVKQGLVRVHRLANGGQPHGGDLALNTLEHVLLCCRADQPGDAPLDPRVRQAVDHLSAHLAEPIKLDQLARLCHVSRSQLASLFRIQVGIPPIEFHERRRIDRAAQMLRMSYHSIKAIAAGLGFSDARYFSKRFRRYMNTTPKLYRRNRG